MEQVRSADVAAQYERPWRRIAADLRTKILSGRWQPGDRLPTIAALQREYGVAKNTIRGAVGLLVDEGLVTTRGASGIYVEEPRPVTEPAHAATAPEAQPVVAAIVTSHLGVLAGKRNDGRPPWTFIAGEVEPGESATDAAVREVKEEAGLLVRAGHQEIGRRVHPKTQRTMIYLACTPTHGTDVFVGDEDELAEVRWLSLAEADTLLPGMFEPVREHLGRVIT
jgi:8-oxo-dGTP pyrophosphatase MutT (NUDIX family)